MSFRIPSFAEALNVARGHGADSENPDAWNDLVGLWTTLQGGGSTLYDLSGYDNNGTLSGMTPASDWVTTKEGYALDFDGDNDHINLGQALNFERTDPFSVNMLIYCNAALAAFTVFTGKTDSDATKRGWAFRNGVAGRRENLALYIISNVGATTVLSVRSTNVIFSAAGWYSVGVTYDGSSDSGGIQFYLDGVAVAMTVIANLLGANTIINSAPAGIAARPEDDAGNFPGKIVTCAVWNRVLSPNEFQQQYVDPHALVRARHRLLVSTAAIPGFMSKKALIIGGGIAI